MTRPPGTPEPVTAVWIRRNVDGTAISAHLHEAPQSRGRAWPGDRVERQTLWSPLLSALIEAAVTYRRHVLHEIGDDWGYAQDEAYDALMTAIDAARRAGEA